MKNISQFILDLDDFESIKDIEGKGGAERVSLVREKKTGLKFISKENINSIQFNNGEGEEQQNAVVQEIQRMMSVHHETVIGLRGFSFQNFSKAKSLTVIMEYMKKGSLLNILETGGKALIEDGFDNTKRQILMIGIAKGMVYLHSRNIIHQNLHPGNILLNSNYEPKITDFVITECSKKSTNICQNLVYTSPEILEGNQYDSKTNVYSFGIMIYEIITSLKPFPNIRIEETNESNFKAQIKKGMRPSFLNEAGKEIQIPKELKSLILLCLDRDPKKRPTFREIYRKLSSNEKYFLSNIKKVKIDEYVEKIENDVDNYEIKEKFSNEMNEMKNEINELKEQFEQALTIIETLSNENKKIKDENQNLKSQMTIENEAIKCEMKIQNDDLRNIFFKQSESQRKENEYFHGMIARRNEKPANQNDLSTNGLDARVTHVESRLCYFLGSFIQSDKESGIISYLYNWTNRVDPIYTFSFSSNDIFSLIDPYSRGYYSTSDNKFFFIYIYLPYPIQINGISITSGNCCFPKTFSICLDQKFRSNYRRVKELNGPFQTKRFDIKTIVASEICFERTEKNWDMNNYVYDLSKIELHSPDARFSKGVFRTLVDEANGRDPHKSKVYILSTNTDYFGAHSLFNEHLLQTLDGIGQYMQFELTRHSALVTAFRITKYKEHHLKDFAFVGSNDPTIPSNQWTMLRDVKETNYLENQFTFVYETTPVMPFKFFRLIITGPTWNGSTRFLVHDIELFGQLYSI